MGRDRRPARTRPVAIVQGTLDRPLTAIECVTTAPAGDAAGAVVSALISIMPADVSVADTSTDSDTLIKRLEPGQLAITVVADWDRLTGVQAPEGAALLLIPAALASQTVGVSDADQTVRA